MKIAIVPGHCVPFHGRSLDERPLGGTESGVNRLATALDALGHTVVVFSNTENPPLTKPIYLPLRAVNSLGPVDVLISVRDITPLFAPIQAKSRFFWTGDSYDQVHSIGLGDRRTIQRVDGLLAVSDWHAQSLCEASGFPLDKTTVIRNGVHLPYFRGDEPRGRKRLIYSSVPYRGLVHHLRLFPEIRKRHPDAELHVFAGYRVYSGPGGYDPKSEAEFEAMARRLSELPGCTVHGNRIQRDLAREFMRSSVLAYPNTFAETSCITVMEAQAAGCVTVTSRRGALPETVADTGLLVDGEPGTPEYDRAFVDSIDNLLSDDGLFELLSARGRARSNENSWDSVARRAASRFEQVLSGR